MTTYNYFVTTDTDDFTDDNGDFQVSLMTQKVSSTTPLTDEDAYDVACDSGDWKVYYGEGDEAKVGTYEVETIAS
jgi:hypothetical protein